MGGNALSFGIRGYHWDVSIKPKLNENTNIPISDAELGDAERCEAKAS